jgi:hypothetical protein
MSDIEPLIYDNTTILDLFNKIQEILGVAEPLLYNSTKTIFDNIKVSANGTYSGVSTLASSSNVASGIDITKSVTPASLVQSLINVPSASSCDITSTSSKYLNITGNTTITSFGSSSATGLERILIFSNNIILTHDTNHIKLPTNNNIITEVGDICKIVQDSSGIWNCHWYTRKSGMALKNLENTLFSTNNLSDVSNAVESFDNIKQSANDSYSGTLITSSQASVGLGSNTTSAVTPNSLIQPLGSIASANNCDIGTVSSKIILITGNESIRTFGNTALVGDERTLIFNENLTLISNDTILQLPSSLDINIYTGDVCKIYCKTTGVWKLTSKLDNNYISNSINILTTNTIIIGEKYTQTLTYIQNKNINDRYVANSSKISNIISNTASMTGYHGGILLPDGRVFCNPDTASAAALYDPHSINIFNTPSLTGYRSSVLLENGDVFCVAYSASNCAIYSPASNTISYTPECNGMIGATVMTDGKIFCVPSSATCARIYDPTANSFSNTPACDGMSGGKLLLDGRIMCIPETKLVSMIYDPLSNTYYNTSALTGMSGGILLANGNVLCIPKTETLGRIYNPQSDTISNTDSFTGCSGGSLLPDGRIFCSPLTSANGIIYDSVANKLLNVGVMTGICGSVLMNDGRIFCIPKTATNGYIISSGNYLNMIPMKIRLSSYLNNF